MLAIPTVAPGLPSQLLQRRPDVAQAEAQLVAASADLDAARTAFFPSISLSGSAGAASTALQTLFDPGSTAWSFAVSAAETIFDAGRRGAQVRASKAREQELVLAYRKAVLSAFSEVDLAMSSIDALAQQRAQVEIELASAREAYRLAQVRYREGATDLTEVLSGAKLAVLGRGSAHASQAAAGAGCNHALSRARRRLGSHDQRSLTAPGALWV